MKKKKRIFAILLSLVVMMMYAMPASVFANESETPGIDNGISSSSSIILDDEKESEEENTTDPVDTESYSIKTNENSDSKTTDSDSESVIIPTNSIAGFSIGNYANQNFSWDVELKVGETKDLGTSYFGTNDITWNFKDTDQGVVKVTENSDGSITVLGYKAGSTTIVAIKNGITTKYNITVKKSTYNHVDVRVDAKLTIATKINGVVVGEPETITVKVSNVSGTVNGSTLNFYKKDGIGKENEWHANIKNLDPDKDTVVINCTLTGTKASDSGSEPIKLTVSKTYTGYDTLFNFIKTCPAHEGYDIDIEDTDLTEYFTVNKTVTKVWNDAGNESKRPGSIDVQLYANNVAYGEPVELNVKNGWSYTYSNLPKYSTGNDEITYAIDEVDKNGNSSVPDGYNKDITKTDNGFTITNTYVPVIPPSVNEYTVTYIAVSDDNSINGRELGTADYTEGETVEKPSNIVPDGYELEGYYTSTECSSEYAFNQPITASHNIYVKLTREEVTYPEVYVYIRILDNSSGEEKDISEVKSSEGPAYTVNGITFTENGDNDSYKWFTIGKTTVFPVPIPTLKGQTIDSGTLTGYLNATPMNALSVEEYELDGNFDGIVANNLWNAIEWESLHTCYGAQSYNTTEEIENAKENNSSLPVKWHLDGKLILDSLQYDANGGTGEMEATEGFTKAEVDVADNGFIAPEGKHFAGWMVDDGDSLVDYDEDSYTLTSGTDILYAKWEDDIYTVTYNDGVEDDVFDDQIYSGLTYGTSTPEFVGTPARSGYVFTGWNPVRTETVTKDVVYEAQWEIDSNNDGIADKYQKEITYKVVNGGWNDTTKGSDPIPKVVTFYEPGTDTPSDADDAEATLLAPEVGNEPASGFIKDGSWNPVVPATITMEAANAMDKPIVYTYTYLPVTPETPTDPGTVTPPGPSGGGTTPIPDTPDPTEPDTPSDPAGDTDTDITPSGDGEEVTDGDINVAPKGDSDSAADKETKGVKTGDETMLAMWLALASLAAIGLCTTLVIGRRRENE